MENIPTPEIQTLLEQRNWPSLRSKLADLSTEELVALLYDLEPPDRALVFRLLPRNVSPEVFAYLSLEEQNELLTALGDEETRELFRSLAPDDRVHLLEEMPGRAAQKLLNMLPRDDLEEARQLLAYPPESVGRLMTPDYVAVRPHWTIARALEHIRSRGRDIETVNVIYVTDDTWKLLDALELRKFIIATPEETVQDIMDYSFVSLPATVDREEAVSTISRYNLDVVPVVGTDEVLLGIVTVDDVMDVAEEEATEDFQKTAAVSPLRWGYRGTSVRLLYQKRIGWLVGLVFVNLISSGVIAAYEELLSATIALAFFIPLLIDSGGNTGAQSATLMVRALATEDVRVSEWLSTLTKEIAVGLALALTMGLATAVLGALRGGWEVGLVVAISMTGIVLVSNLIGTLLPFLLIKIRLDPAAAGSPLITSIADATGLLLYFRTAVWILG